VTVHKFQQPPSSKNAVKLIGLVRVSTEEQADEGRAGIERQVEAIERIVQAEPNCTLMETITLKGVSGSDVPLTAEWRNIILPALQNPETHLAVAAVDRLLRPDNFDFSVLEELQRTQTKLYTPGGIQDPASVAGYLVLGLGSVIGGYEKLQIKERVYQAKEVKRRRGEHPQSTISLPTGVTYDRDTNRWHYTDDSERVRKAYEMLVREGETCQAEICRATGIKSIATLKSVLRNPIYRGERVIDTKRGTQVYTARRPGKQADRRKVPRADEEIIKFRAFGGTGQEPQLVSDDIWHRAQEILAANKKRHTKARSETTSAAPYSGVFYSAAAGPDYPHHQITGHSIGFRGVWYECRCRRLPRKERCNLRGLPVEPINTALDNLLVRLTIDPWFVDTVLIPQFRVASSRVDVDLDAARKMLRSTEGKLQRLQDAYVDGRMEQDYYHRKLGELRATRCRQQADVERLQQRVAEADSGDAGKKVKEYWETLVGKFDRDWPPDLKVGFVRQHFSEIIISETGVDLFVVRVPQGPDGLLEDLRVIPDRTTWVDLLGYDPFNKSERLAAEGKYTSAKISERLGLKGSQEVNYLLKRGVLPKPVQLVGGVRYWSEDEAQAAEAAHKEHIAEPPIYKWGLPRKERYYRSDVVQILGITMHQARYWRERGKLQRASGRDASGAHYWKEEVIEQMVANRCHDADGHINGGDDDEIQSRR
jgi:DNA invertase Pin-like site-specific DNA recombinase